MEGIRKLKEAGLYVESIKDGYFRNGYDVCIYEEEKYKELLQKLIKRVDTKLYPKAKKWIFEFWHDMPGPSSDEFRCLYNSLDEAITPILDFYFGKPTIIDGWVVPLHKHPEIAQENIKNALSNLHKTTFAQFALMNWLNEIKKQDSINKAKEPVNYSDEYIDSLFRDEQEYDEETFLVSFQQELHDQFIEISNEQNNWLLQLRRDLSEGFIITDLDASAVVSHNSFSLIRYK